jgi:hypothetical protein
VRVGTREWGRASGPGVGAWYTGGAPRAGARGGSGGTTVTRRIRLACEACDYAAELAERVPFAMDDAGEAVALPAESGTTPDGYFSDWLCGECRRPVRVRRVDGAAGGGEHCPACGSALLSFDEAARELAEASRSRVWRDLAVERDGAERVRAAMLSVAGLEEARGKGERTTQEALDALAAGVTPGAGEPLAGELASSVALGGLAELIENAADLGAARSLLRTRDEMSAKHIAVLERWCADERELQGVPCPQCGTGQLVHWPAWG